MRRELIKDLAKLSIEKETLINLLQTLDKRTEEERKRIHEFLKECDYNGYAIALLKDEELYEYFSLDELLSLIDILLQEAKEAQELSYEIISHAYHNFRTFSDINLLISVVRKYANHWWIKELVLNENLNSFPIEEHIEVIDFLASTNQEKEKQLVLINFFVAIPPNRFLSHSKKMTLAKKIVSLNCSHAAVVVALDKNLLHVRTMEEQLTLMQKIANIDKEHLNNAYKLILDMDLNINLSFDKFLALLNKIETLGFPDWTIEIATNAKAIYRSKDSLIGLIECCSEFICDHKTVARVLAVATNVSVLNNRTNDEIRALLDIDKDEDYINVVNELIINPSMLQKRTNEEQMELIRLCMEETDANVWIRILDIVRDKNVVEHRSYAEQKELIELSRKDYFEGQTAIILNQHLLIYRSHEEHKRVIEAAKNKSALVLLAAISEQYIIGVSIDDQIEAMEKASNGVEIADNPPSLVPVSTEATYSLMDILESQSRADFLNSLDALPEDIDIMAKSIPQSLVRRNPGLIKNEDI